MKALGRLPAEDRPSVGEAANRAKNSIEGAVAARLGGLAEAAFAHDLARAVDVTLPGRGERLGTLHPLTQVRREIERIEGFDPDLAQAIVHIILSHHGSLEHGSPVVPATREATLVHAIDNLGGKLGSFDRLERELADGESWSRFDRGIDGSAFFGSRAA
jgi:23S rRNA maturation-related 3'-5' exoribonuclease YhaM